MGKLLSVIVPNFNGGTTLAACLEALLSSRHESFEVVVVDDCSTDNSTDIISQHPCRLIRLERRSGASVARNTGALNSSGEILFFIDADCVVLENTLTVAESSIHGRDVTVCGGTYTKLPFDKSFFSTFQSIFINYSETRNAAPDYVASHAMVISKDLFLKSGGFPENFLPILEDVEFSHRLRRNGVRLVMNPALLVRHIFNFTLLKSLRNAYRKSRYWTVYSLKNRDLFSDSGTASKELKADVVLCFSSLPFALAGLHHQSFLWILPVMLLQLLNLFLSRHLIFAFYTAKGLIFTAAATAYYAFVYPLAVGTGALHGLAAYFTFPRKLQETG